MPDLWLPGVQRLDCSSRGLGLGYGNWTDAYHTWHTFEGIPANYRFDVLAGARYLSQTNNLATFTYNPVLGGICQLLPANMGARTLKAGSGTYYNAETNRRGKVHMQTEVLANAARPWTLDLTREGIEDLTRLMNFLRSWGVADQWAWGDMSRPAATYAEANRPGYRVWPTRSGHTVHSRWPHNSHWDPGAIAAPWSVVTTPAQPDENYRKAQTLLAELGYDIGPDGADGFPGPNTDAGIAAYAADTDYTGKTTAALITHLEDSMSKLTDLAREVTTIHGRVKKQGGQLDRLERRDHVSAEDVATAVWSRELYGFAAHYWLRDGAIGDPDHPNFPADPGTRADAFYAGIAAAGKPVVPHLDVEITPEIRAKIDARYPVATEETV